MLQGLLTYDPVKRISAENALKSPWFCSKEEIKLQSSNQEKEISLSKLKHFRTQTAMQKVVLTYFATLQVLPEEEEKLREVFASFDHDHDGLLSLDDLIRQCETLYGDRTKAKQVAERIMKKIDLNRNGSIDFTGK